MIGLGPVAAGVVKTIIIPITAKAMDAQTNTFVAILFIFLMYQFSTVRTTGPATRAAHPAFHFRESFFDANIPRLRFFARRNPANPLTAGERSNIVP